MKDAVSSFLALPFGVIYSLIMLVISAMTGVGSSDAQTPTEPGAYLHVVDRLGVGRSGCYATGWTSLEGVYTTDVAGMLQMHHATPGTFDVSIKCGPRLSGLCDMMCVFPGVSHYATKCVSVRLV